MLYAWLAIQVNKRVFQTTNDGQILFYPHSYVGNGYIIPSDQIYKRILRGYIGFLIVSVPLGLIGAFLILKNNLISFLGILLIFCIVYFVWVRIEVRDLVKFKPD
jgi:hypothetical protein